MRQTSMLLCCPHIATFLLWKLLLGKQLEPQDLTGKCVLLAQLLVRHLHIRIFDIQKPIISIKIPKNYEIHFYVFNLDLLFHFWCPSYSSPICGLTGVDTSGNFNYQYEINYLTANDPVNGVNI